MAHTVFVPRSILAVCVRRAVILFCWVAFGLTQGMVHAQPHKPFEDTLAQRLQACTGCHGDQGRAGPDGYYPRLAGKPAIYLYKQLLDFRDGRRHYTLMAGLLEPLSDAYLFDMARYFAALDVPYPAPLLAATPLGIQLPGTTPAHVNRGEQLAKRGDGARQLPACAACHGERLTGMLPQTPSLLGLSVDYLNAQLGGWRTGQRHGTAPDCMAGIVRRMQPADVSAVSAWLANQPVPADHRPQPAPGKALSLTEATLLKSLPCSVTLPPAPIEASMPTGPQAATESPQASRVARGAYLARLGNCQTCHSQPGAAPWAGGRSISTPFGAVFTSNLTSDRTHGLGQWSTDDFWQALHYGKGRDGRLLAPVFPYTSYTRVNREDADALFAFLRQLPPVPRENQAHQLRWPFNTQWALWIWRQLFFKPQEFKPDLGQSAQWNRGRYLVEGLGHCSACHADRNALGATGPLLNLQWGSRELGGGVIPMQNWFAPALSGLQGGALHGWRLADLETLLKQGVSATAATTGPMALVVLGSTQYWTAGDLQALGSYLIGPPASITGQPKPLEAAAPPAKAAMTRMNNPGAKIYEAHCAQCHGLQGLGTSVRSASGERIQAYPRLANNPAINASNPVNAVQMVLRGGFPPATAGNPQPFGMPPFQLTLSDAQIASVLRYIRSEWSPNAAAISELDVSKVRNSTER